MAPPDAVVLQSLGFCPIVQVAVLKRKRACRHPKRSMPDDPRSFEGALRDLWSRPVARRAILGGGAGVAVVAGAGGTYLATRPAAKTSAATAGPPIKGVVTFTGKGKAKSIDHIDLPLTLVVPGIGIEAPVIAVGLTNDGAMDVPKRPSDVGWFEYSPRPGLAGNSILAGHLDWQGTPGVFAKLAGVKNGEAVVIRESDGAERGFAVEWKREVAAEAPPPKQVFEPIISPGLTLITCGGRFNPATRRYDTRIVVRAIRK